MLGFFLNLFTTIILVSLLCDGKFKEAATLYGTIALFCVLMFAVTIVQNKRLRIRFILRKVRMLKKIAFYSLLWPYWFLKFALDGNFD